MHHDQLQWVEGILIKKGYEKLTPAPLIIQDNPWSTVYRFETNKGFLFLKCVPSELSLESKVIKMLNTEFHYDVPFVIAENNDLFCFLMADAGIQLHEYFKQNYQSSILIHTMQIYSDLQIKSIDKISQFLELGIPDWRLENLPSLYQNIINENELLLDDGLSKTDIEKLKQLSSKLISFCSELAKFNIKNTFGHADFHDKNICIDPATKKTTVIDLGEVVITYPLFSWLNCLHRAKENFTLTEKQYHQLQMDCLTPWLAFESKENLLTIIKIINQCWPIHSVLGEYRLMKSVNRIEYEKLLRQGRFARNFRYWLNLS